ncbi:hypothetical protein BDV96DRAFT_567110 [Lophiotrema nucula]|uniref:Cora-like Mg2+ transporter protein-domain-containing protein n=1 Tax=Lophiotrema nucula TaxID=690887 RepID=A0A6A5ZL82_9PLEO|nr:hypothetical protein BDV96DRAFT_567110 [Lophiotrema nucula]
MNWARDDTGLNEEDLGKVFRYAPRDTTVVRILRSNSWEARIDVLDNAKQWREWTEDSLPRSTDDDSGLILLLAKRKSEHSLSGVQDLTPEEWLSEMNNNRPPRSGMVRSDTLSRLGEKCHDAKTLDTNPMSDGQRGLRTLPFSRDTFEMVAQSFYVHGSIARVVSRADVPTFTHEKVNMTQPAYIYNCRSSNAWPMDLALTSTHFPRKRLTFAILFGCSFSTEVEVITRLRHVQSEAGHPLLVPGIFVELERARHVRLVEEMGNETEAVIFDLESTSHNLEGSQGAMAEQRNRDKRTAYLDLAYLRNALVSWNRQLTKMIRHCQNILDGNSRNSVDMNRQRTSARCRLEETDTSSEDESFQRPTRSHSWKNIDNTQEARKSSELIHDVGYKINSRLLLIRDEYDDKIRECTMRVDGMAMATQWALGEINVDIALATNRDSRHMRSIALVTMIFLPGTFFASMFSMTFFNWSNEPGSPMVSTYLWIYVLITVVFTALTIGLWYYIVIFRPSRQRIMADEEDPERQNNEVGISDRLKSWWQILWQKERA